MLHLLVVVALASTFPLVQHFDGLHQVALEGRERGADGGASETVGEEAEVGEASLHAGLQTRGGSTAAQRGAVLGHEVHKLLTDLPGRNKRKESFRRVSSNSDKNIFKSTGGDEALTHLVAINMLRRVGSCSGSLCLHRYSAVALAGNSVSQT